MSTSSPLPADIGKIAEPLLLGHLLQWCLFGALSVQVYIYHLAFPEDPPQRKVLVYGVYIAEFVQAILLAKMAYTEFAAGFGDFRAIDDSGLLWFAVPVMSSIVGFVVQTFYAYRIKILAESYVIPIVVVLFSLVQLGGGIALGVCAEQTPLFSKLLVRKTLIATGIWNAGSAACDVIIAGAMTYYLSRRKTPWKQTNRLIQRLTRLILETGTLTAAIAIVNLIMYLIPGQPTYFQTTSAVLGKMYSSTMMVVLNSRMVFSRKDSGSNELLSMVSSSLNRRPVLDTSHGGITVTQESWSDPLEGYKIDGTARELEEGNSETVRAPPKA